jgi:hypothetical protein
MFLLWVIRRRLISVGIWKIAQLPSRPRWAQSAGLSEYPLLCSSKHCGQMAGCKFWRSSVESLGINYWSKKREERCGRYPFSKKFFSGTKRQTAVRTVNRHSCTQIMNCFYTTFTMKLLTLREHLSISLLLLKLSLSFCMMQDQKYCGTKGREWLGIWLWLLESLWVPSTWVGKVRNFLVFFILRVKTSERLLRMCCHLKSVTL